MMQQSISRRTLCGYLNLLRNVMEDESNFPPRHVKFFNTRSLYLYLEQQPCGKSTVGDVLKKIEHCIPLAFSLESIDLFLSACENSDSAQKAASFMESSKADFLLLIGYAASDQKNWQAVSGLCEELRTQTQTHV